LAPWPFVDQLPKIGAVPAFADVSEKDHFEFFFGSQRVKGANEIILVFMMANGANT
jgi:hypothetical protein